MISILKITVKPSCCKEDTVYFSEGLYTATLEQGDWKNLKTMMWAVIALHGIIYQNLIWQTAFQKRSCTTQDWGFSLFGEGGVGSLPPSFFHISCLGTRVMSLDIRKIEHSVKPWFSLVKWENAMLNPKKQHRLHNLLSNPQAAIQLAWVTSIRILVAGGSPFSKWGMTSSYRDWLTWQEFWITLEGDKSNVEEPMAKRHAAGNHPSHVKFEEQNELR